jgi:hypothetical protein
LNKVLAKSSGALAAAVSGVITPSLPTSEGSTLLAPTAAKKVANYSALSSGNLS